MFVRILIGVGIFLVVAFIGLITQLVDYRKQVKQRNFIVEYNNVFYKFLEHKDEENYDHLLRNMNKAQGYLGYNGLVSGFKPFSPIYQRNLPVLSFLIEIREEQRSGYYIDIDTHIEHINTALKRTIGDYDNNLEKISNQAKNVLIDFYKGFNWIIIMPFVALGYMFTGKNIFHGHIARPLKVAWKVSAFIIQFISITSGIMTIFLGYEDFYKLIHSWFG